MDIKTGDWIKVPKGTHLMMDYTKGNYGEGKEPTSRDVVVQVSHVKALDSYYLRTLLSREDFQAYQDECAKWPNPNTHGGAAGQYTDETRTRDQAGLNAAREAALAKIPGQPKSIVCWSNDKKGVLDIEAEKVEAPAPKKKAEVKVNKRQQMVPKSKWALTQDLAITFTISNPEVRKQHDAWVAANPRPLDTGGTMDEDMAWREIAIANRQGLEVQLGKTVEAVVRRCKSGELFTVAGKFQTYNPYDILDNTAGAIAYIQFDGDAKPVHARYKQLEPIIEADSIPTVDVYVLRKIDTGMFYKPASYDAVATEEARDAKRKAEGLAATEYVRVDYVYTEPYTDAFMKAKHFDGLGRAKTQILMMSGYYNDLPGADEALPDWAGGYGFDPNDGWELVHFDKLARKEVGIVEDFLDWYKRSWELRKLTVKYGSSVRTCYKELEKKNLLGTQKGMLVFTVTDPTKLDNVGYYGDSTAVSADDDAAINQAIAAAGFKKGTFKKAKDAKSVAVSFANKGAALLFKLGYTGNLKSVVIDLEDMTEVVEANA